MNGLDKFSLRKHDRRVLHTVAIIVVGIGLTEKLVPFVSYAGPTILELQKAPEVLGPWQKVPADGLAANEDLEPANRGQNRPG